MNQVTVYYYIFDRNLTKYFISLKELTTDYQYEVDNKIFYEVHEYEDYDYYKLLNDFGIKTQDKNVDIAKLICDEYNNCTKPTLSKRLQYRATYQIDASLDEKRKRIIRYSGLNL